MRKYYADISLGELIMEKIYMLYWLELNLADGYLREDDVREVLRKQTAAR